MKKVIIISVLLFCSVELIFAQSISSAIHHNDSFKPDLRKHIRVKKIIQETIFFNSKGQEIEKTEIVLNDSNRIVTENRFNESYNRTTRLYVKYDSTQVRSISRRIDINQPYISNSNTAYYEFDHNGFLIKITDKNKDVTFRITTIVNNEKGDPIKLEVFENSIFYGGETAEYDYENNIVKTTYYDANGKVISVNTGIIDYTISDSKGLINDYGDLIESDLFKFEYKYDKKGNWKMQKRYMWKNNKWVKNAIFKRTLIYK